eukprot:COSAG06_NODE_9001_length_2015_cov_3.140919_2_plen_101_part_00
MTGAEDGCFGEAHLISGEAKSPAGNRASIPITQAPRDRHATASTEPVAQSTQRVRITIALRAHARISLNGGGLALEEKRRKRALKILNIPRSCSKAARSF